MQVDCFITESRIQYISCRLIERKINIQIIEYGLKKKQTIQETKVTLYDLEETELVTAPTLKSAHNLENRSLMKMVQPAGLDCNK